MLWPFGHTRADVTEGMTRDDSDTFAALGTSMARTNGYTPEQASDLYFTDGALDDWLWGANGVFAFTFEMYPREAIGARLLPARRGDRPRDAAQPRGRPAAAGERRLPVRRDRQGRAALPRRADDVDLRRRHVPAPLSPPIALTGSANFGVSFRYRSTHKHGSLRVRVIGGTATRTLLPRLTGRTGGWQNASVSLSRFAGQTVRIEISEHDARVAGLRVNRY